MIHLDGFNCVLKVLSASKPSKLQDILGEKEWLIYKYETLFKIKRCWSIEKINYDPVDCYIVGMHHKPPLGASELDYALCFFFGMEFLKAHLSD